MEQGSSPSPKSSLPDESSVAASALPSNVEGCHALIAELSSSVSELHGAKVKLGQEIEELKRMIARLMQGHRRERHVDDPNQMKLGLGDDTESQDALAEAAAEADKVLGELEDAGGWPARIGPAGSNVVGERHASPEKKPSPSSDGVITSARPVIPAHRFPRAPRVSPTARRPSPPRTRASRRACWSGTRPTCCPG